jgi:hypothetical protein
MGRKRKFINPAKCKAVFDSCCATVRGIRAAGPMHGTDYADERGGTPNYCAGRPSKTDFICDVTLAVRHVISRLTVPFWKFESAYLMPVPTDLDDHERYAEGIFKDRDRRAVIEYKVELEFLKRWGGYPKAYFSYQRTGIDEWKNSAATNVRYEKLRVSTDGGDSPSQSEIESLLDTAFAYQEAQGGAPDEPILEVA